MSNNNSEEHNSDDDLFLGDDKDQEVNEKADKFEDLDEDIELGNNDDTGVHREAKILNEEELSSVMTFTQVEQPHPSHSDEIYISKLSSNIKAESSPFDRNHYRIMYGNKKRKDVEAVMRWKFKKNSNQEKESNAKIVEWEDGTMNLFIGSKLVYSVEKKALSRGVNDLFCIPYSPKTTYVCDGLMQEKLILRKLGDTNFNTFEKKTRSLKLQETAEDPEFLKRQKEKEYLNSKKRKSKKSKPRVPRGKKNEDNSPRLDDEEEEEEDVYEDQLPNDHTPGKRRNIDEESIYSAKSNPSHLNVAFKKRRNYDEEESDKDDVVLYDSDDNSPAPTKEKDALIIDDDDEDFD